MAKIFISYRRVDSGPIAGRINENLIRRFGRGEVFFDVDDIPPGVSFPAFIHSAIAQTAVMLVIIGPQWLTAEDYIGVRRIDDTNDFVRIEVEAGLTQGIRVIPVLVGGASMPVPDLLPASLQALSYLQAITVRSDPSFGADLERLFAAIEQAMRPVKRPTQPRPAPIPGPSQPPALPPTKPDGQVGEPRASELAAAYESNTAGGRAPYEGVSIRSLSEVQWILSSRQWSGEPGAAPSNTVNLSGASLRSLDLTSIHLYGANLANAELHGCILRGANLGEANLGGSHSA